MTATTDGRQQEYWEQDHGHRAYDHDVVRLFAEQRVALMDSWMDLRQVRRALDVGCGNGFSTFYVGQRVPAVWATDRSARMLARHPLRGAGRLAAADVRALPYNDACFDLVYGWEILHHVSQPELVVEEMARVSRRYVLLVEPNRNHPAQFAFALADREHRWVLRYSRAYLEGIARRAGLRVVRSATGGHVFPNRSPRWLAHGLAHLPYETRFGISNWVLGETR